MLTEVKNNYKSILKHFDFDESISSADYKKQKLMEMAKKGESKPHYESKLGKSLISYTRKSGGGYCPIFDKTIRKLRPDWFVTISQAMKQKLISMARNGAKRPMIKTKEGDRLSDYINKPSRAYCPIFDKTIRKLRPDWFVSTSQAMKQKLIAMARNGAKRPSNRKTKEGRSLASYTVIVSKAYCPIFDKTIRKLRPDWFVSSKSQIMKNKLISIAKNGAKRPSHGKTNLGRRLYNYTNKSSRSYCPIFDKTIRKLRPDWFVSTSQAMKQKLISMARNGAKRPSNRKTKEGQSLTRYTIKSSGAAYCPIFDKTIRKLRPDWFVFRAQKTQNTNQNKKELIEMAKNNEPRPVQKKTKIGRLLSKYTLKSSGSYCQDFDKTIRKLRPDWFRKCSPK